jgi:NTE family protein
MARASGLWAVAADYASGKRVAFGRDGAPSAAIADAVAASCAIPGFYHPVRVAGRRYVDGGICSTSNLDLLCDARLDLVLCLNPMSSFAAMTGGSPADRFAALMRAAAGRRLGHEAEKLRAAGTEVLVLQPGGEDCALMGMNLMSGARRVEVMHQARESVARELRVRSIRLPVAAGPPGPRPAARRAA